MNQPSAWLISSLVGIGVMVVVNQAGHGGDLLSIGQYLAPKGVLFGLLAALVARVGMDLLIRSSTVRRWSLLLAAVVTGLFSLLVINWNLMWGVPLTTLEGAWLWPLAIASLIGSTLLFRRWLTTRRKDPNAVGIDDHH
jgi:hypothetical protein